jgi:hypothetical protein
MSDEGICRDCRHAVPIYPPGPGRASVFNPETYTHCDVPRHGLPMQSWAKGKGSPCIFHPSRWEAV